MAFADIRQFMRHLEERGKLYRFPQTINKDTELYPIYRVQVRGLPDEERRVFLFENVVGATGQKYELRVLVGVYGVSDEILAMHLQCKNHVEMLEKWHRAYANPIPPVVVESGPVQEVVHTGREITEIGLDEFPVPVEEPGFSGLLRSGLPMVSKDPVTGIRNVGTYNAQFRARDRFAGGGAWMHHLLFYHWRTARARGEDLPVAIVVGPPVGVMALGSAPTPYGTDDLAVVGGLNGKALELVRCKTIPVEVPAHAEIIIEGMISRDTMEPKGGYGEYPGYINVDHAFYPVIRVTGITHRKDAMWTPIQVGFTPSDCNAIWSYAQSGGLYQYLKYDKGFPIEEVYYPQMAGAADFQLIRVAAGTSQETVREIMQEGQKAKPAKYTITLDSDINLHDPDLLVWALAYRTIPKRDFEFIEGGQGGLDPAAAPIGVARRTKARGEGIYSRVLINATMKWPYPPVALPARPYMERALEMWKGFEGLPVPRMREPWYGYTLGHWNEDLQEDASLLVQGKYHELGKKYEKQQEPIPETVVKSGRGPSYDELPLPKGSR